MNWKAVHRWLGLSLGTVARVLGLSGALLALDPVQEAWQALSGRAMPDTGALRALARTLKRWGVCRLVDSEDDDPQPFHLRVRPAIVEIVGEQWLQRLDQHNLGDVEGDDGEGEDDAAA